MIIYQGDAAGWGPIPGGSAVAIGVFDGVHRGHRALHATAKELAQPQGARVVVLTFDPHPNVTLDPINQPPRLLSLIHISEPTRLQV